MQVQAVHLFRKQARNQRAAEAEERAEAGERAAAGERAQVGERAAAGERAQVGGVEEAVEQASPFVAMAYVIKQKPQVIALQTVPPDSPCLPTPPLSKSFFTSFPPIRGTKCPIRQCAPSAPPSPKSGALAIARWL